MIQISFGDAYSLVQWRQSGLKSGGSWIRIKKVSIFPANFRKFRLFSRQIFETFSIFQAISQKFRFPRQKLVICSYLWANYSISLQSHHIWTCVL